MCSIYGTIGKNYKQIEPIFFKNLSHRGPDDSGIYVDDDRKLALGHTRLSIIDLSDSAHQPMTDETKNYILIFNGEIYNYKEIKNELDLKGYKFYTNSDTEVVLKSYIEWKDKCLNKFRGMFAFCIYDKNQQKIFLARDRFGIKPLIYTFYNNEFYFSSELKPFLESSLIQNKLSLEALSDYYKFGSVRQPKTILANVYHLMPSSYMQVDVNTLDCKIVKYYDYVEESLKLPEVNDYNKAVKLLRQELEIATRYHLVADVEVGAFLSGGVDSTAVVALMSKYTSKPINTFSVGFKQKMDVIDETEIASRTAKFLNTNHHNIKIDDEYVRNIIDDFIYYLDQPSIDGINTFIVSHETSKELKVALSGLGGDEIFAGYPHFKNVVMFTRKKDTFISKVGKFLNNIRPNRWTNKYQFYGLTIQNAIIKQRTINNNLSKIFNDRVLNSPSNNFNSQISQELSFIQEISKYEINNYLLNTLLRDTDVVSMAHSLEVRPILLDHRLVEFVFHLEDEYKISDNLLKAVFIDSVKDIIPGEVWNRKKTGFEMPFATWLNGKLNTRFLDVVQNKKLYNLFHKSYLDKLKKRIRDKKLKRNDWIDFIFFSWLNRFKVEV
jgi:asparagine synthase (glutamine-hydrolysing)